MTRAIVGMEALVRWNHPTRGCVPPSEFMPLLESTGLDHPAGPVHLGSLSARPCTSGRRAAAILCLYL